MNTNQRIDAGATYVSAIEKAAQKNEKKSSKKIRHIIRKCFAQVKLKLCLIVKNNNALTTFITKGKMSRI